MNRFRAFLSRFEHRELVPERMDEPGVDPGELAAGLDWLARLNAVTGVRRGLLRKIIDMLPDPGVELIRILDVGTGGGDIPTALVRGFDRAGYAARVVGLDLHAATLGFARTRTTGTPGVHLVGGDARGLPFADRSFDLVVAATFLHQLDPGEAATCLREMKRVTRHGLLVLDLERSSIAWLGVSLITAASGNPVTRHDGPASVRRAFTAAELGDLARGAGLDRIRVERWLPFRILLTAG